ncbi:Copper transport protein YcnJ [Streptomyces sp. enrichment culture]
MLGAAPRELTLGFTESVGLLDGSVRVFDPANHRVETGDARHGEEGDDTVRVSLPGGLGEGTYTVAWRVVSADSHPVSGVFTFSVGEPTPTGSVAAVPAEDPGTVTLQNTARYLAYLAAALLLGAAVFAAVCRPAAPERLGLLVWGSWWVLVGTTLALLLLRAPYEAGTGPAGAVDVEGLRRTLGGRTGLVLVVRLGLLMAAGLYLRWRPAGWGRAVGGVLGVGLAVTWAAAEHASAGIQVPVAVVSSTLHLLAVSVWLGGLVALLRTMPSRETVVRFSRLAFGCVVVLALTGVYQSWRGLGSVDALTGTSYGRILLVKLGAVVLLLTAAAFSRRWTVRPAAAPEGLRRSVLGEVVVGVLVLVLTTLLTATLPGRAAEASEAATLAADTVTSTVTVPFDVGTPGGRGKVQVSLDPARVGTNSVEAVVFGADGGFAVVPELRISFTLAEQDLGPLDARVEDRGGYWGTDELTLPVAGEWTMKVTVRVSELDQVTEAAKVRIGR